MKKILQLFFFISISCISFTSLIYSQQINSPTNVKFQDNRSEKDKQIFTDEMITSMLADINMPVIKVLPDSSDTDAFTSKTFNGALSGDQFGYSVSGAGDVNNDGFDDIIIGAHNNDAVASNAGRAYIFFGDAVVNTVADVTLSGESANNTFGFSVSSAGDVNGDNYADVIVGAPGHNSSTGRAYIYFGGAAMNNTADVFLIGEGAGHAFGYSVSEAGNVNGDAYDDVIVGAHGFNSLTGRIYVYYGGASMNNIADVKIAGSASSNHFGASVANAGDINSDGYSDLIIGAYGFSGSTGRAYIYKGALSMDTIADVTMTGEATSNLFGISISTAGDVNADGYSDVVVGASGHSSGKGKAYLYYGATSMDNIADVSITGEVTGNEFGISVSDAGDVNGDGYADIIIGAHKFTTKTGKTYVYFGSTSVNSTPDMMITGEATNNYFNFSASNAGDVNGDGYSDLVMGAYGNTSSTGRAYLHMYGMKGVLYPKLTMTGEFNNNYFGYCVSSAGDVNNDGYDDVAVGAYVFDLTFTGRVYIYYGGQSMNTVADVILNGENVNNYFGYSISPAGDVNNDNYDDVIVGAYGYGTNQGRSYIYFGGAAMNNVADVTMWGTFQSVNFGISVSNADDVNNDNYDDVIIGASTINTNTGRAYIYYGGASMNNIADVTLIGETTESYFGESVACAGNVNNDNYSDVIVGAKGYSSNTGRAYIYYGGASMDPNIDVTLNGETANSYFGFDVSTAGDVNKDIYSDVIVGAYGHNSSRGKVYVYYGGASMNSTVDVTFLGENANDFFGHSLCNAGDINKDGYSDIMIGAEQYASSTGKVYIYFGGTTMNSDIDITMTGETANLYYGKSVSSAGDINADGNNDLITGANNFNIAMGKSYVYLTTTPDVNPSLLSVTDVSNDQGGFVNLKWRRSAYDDNLTGLIDDYLVERSIPPDINGYHWTTAGTVNADLSSIYNFPAPTPTNSDTYFFRIKARTSNVNQFWYSNILSGSSLINIAYGTLNLGVIMEGLYDAANDSMRMSDTVKIYLRNSSAPYSINDSSVSTIDAVNFTGSFQISNAGTGSYYIVVRHRNSIDTWSSSPVNYIINGTFSYNFFTSLSQAFGNNMSSVDTSPVRFGIFGGDAVKDNSVDVTDIIAVFNDVNTFTSGYVLTDINGDNFVDSDDLIIASNNSNSFVSTVAP